MESLPPELLCHIAEYCGKDALLQISRTNRAWRDITVPLVFEHVYTGFLPEHIQRLSDLAASPLAKHVRHLTANTDALPDLDKTAWKRFVMNTLYETSDKFQDDDMDDLFGGHYEDSEIHDILTSEYGGKTLESGWAQYQKLIHAQRTCHRSEYLALLQGALCQLNNLESVDFLYQRKHLADSPQSTRAARAPCSPWKGTMIDPLYYHEEIGDDWMLDDSIVNPDRDGFHSSCAIYHMGEALVRRHRVKEVKPVVEITLDVGHHCPLFDMYKDILLESDSAGHPTVSLTISFLRSLRRVNLSAVAPQFQHAPTIAQETFRALVQASGLRHLEIDVGRYVEALSDYDECFSSLKQTPWPQLEHLRLSGCISYEGLLRLTVLNSKSLKRLELLGVDLDAAPGPSRRWDDLFEKLRSALQLETANLRALAYQHEHSALSFFTSPNDNETSEMKSAMNRCVEQYLIGETDSLPRQEYWDYIGDFVEGYEFRFDIEAWCRRQLQTSDMKSRHGGNASRYNLRPRTNASSM